MTENWKPVVGFEGKYEVSDLGRVRSTDRTETYVRRDQYSGLDITVIRRHKGRILRPGPSISGHLSVVLGRNNTRSVHVLVLEAFKGPCPEGCECCHDNDVPNDNRLCNLDWGTRSKNLLDAVRNGKKAIGCDVHFSKLSLEDATAIKLRVGNRPKGGARGGKKNMESFGIIAAEYGVSETAVRLIVRGKTWKHIR